MRSVRVVLALLLSAAALFAQTDRSTITGTIIDPAGAVVANAGIEVRNPATGALFTIGTSNTGNYTVTVPAATYELTITAAGFKKYVRTGIEVPAATTVRQDVTLEVGATSETITVAKDGLYAIDLYYFENYGAEGLRLELDGQTMTADHFYASQADYQKALADNEVLDPERPEEMLSFYRRGLFRSRFLRRPAR